MPSRDRSAETTLGEALLAASARLAAAGVEQPRREARLLAGHVLGVPPSVWLDPAQPVDAAALDRLAARRATREPLALITGRQGFWSLDLAVSPDTLIPRPDSETLIEAALALRPDRRGVRRVLDLGTGTGCLLLAALHEYKEAFGVGIDLSERACRLARCNAAANGLAARAAFAVADWSGPLTGQFDLILCNPPYVAENDLPGLAPELGYEPRRALDGGAGGLEAYAALIPGLPGLLDRQNGLVIVELGAGQASAVLALANRHALRHIETRRDGGGIERALVLTLR